MTEIEMYGEPIEGKVVGQIGEATYYVFSGRGSGKSQAQREMAAQMGLYIIAKDSDFNPEAPTVADLQNATRIEGVTDISFGPFDVNEPVFTGTNFTAQMQFERDFVLTREQMRSMYSWAVEDSRYKAKVLGQWDYTPADELMHRLNTRLQGKEPGIVSNTRYWRGL